MLEQTQGLHLQAKFHLNVFIVSASNGQKPQFWTNLDILGGSCIDPLLLTRAKFGVLEQTQGLRLRAKFRLDRFILSPSGGEKPPIFAIFSTSAFSVVANWQQSDKVEHRYTTTNLPLPNGIKIVSVLQRLHGEIGRTNSDVQKRDGQADRQTKNSTFLATRRRVKSEPHQTWHGDRGPRARSFTSKTFPGLTHSFAARGR